MGVISGEIYWDNMSSADMNVIVESAPDLPIPARKMEVISVPGRNGDIVISQDAYENVTQEYKIAIIGEDQTLPKEVRAVMEWLMRPVGYARLEDSFNPDVFRMAYYKSSKSVVNSLNTLGRATIQFECKPQRFLRIGEHSILASSGMKLSNPSPYTAKPIIAIKGTGTASLTVGDSVVSISAFGTGGEIDLDCESQSAFYGTTNMNDKISITSGGFPELKEGDTQISWTGNGVTEVIITPRWWII